MFSCSAVQINMLHFCFRDILFHPGWLWLSIHVHSYYSKGWIVGSELYLPHYYFVPRLHLFFCFFFCLFKMHGRCISETQVSERIKCSWLCQSWDETHGCKWNFTDSVWAPNPGSRITVFNRNHLAKICVSTPRHLQVISKWKYIDYFFLAFFLVVVDFILLG